MFNGGGESHKDTGYRPPRNTWIHYAQLSEARRDQYGNTKIFINGQPYTDFLPDGTSRLVSNTIRLGRDHTLTKKLFGALHNVQLYREYEGSIPSTDREIFRIYENEGLTSDIRQPSRRVYAAQPTKKYSSAETILYASSTNLIGSSVDASWWSSVYADSYLGELYDLPSQGSYYRARSIMLFKDGQYHDQQVSDFNVSRVEVLDEYGNDVALSSYGSVVSASNAPTDSNILDNLVDGNDTTYANESSGDTIKWFRIEFPQVVNVSSIRVRMRNGYLSSHSTADGRSRYPTAIKLYDENYRLIFIHSPSEWSTEWQTIPLYPFKGQSYHIRMGQYTYKNTIESSEGGNNGDPLTLNTATQTLVSSESTMKKERWVAEYDGEINGNSLATPWYARYLAYERKTSAYYNDRELTVAIWINSQYIHDISYNKSMGIVSNFVSSGNGKGWRIFNTIHTGSQIKQMIL